MMRGGTAWVVFVALVGAGGPTACDDMPSVSSQAPDASPPPAASTAVADDTIAGAVATFWTAAESYASRCYVIDDANVYGVSDRCYALRECSRDVRLNIDKNCGFRPEQPKAVIAAAAALVTEAQGITLSSLARVFVRHAELFGDFVARSYQVNPRCLEVSDAFYRHDCWSTTAGTLARYQDATFAYNRWRPADARKPVPVAGYIVSGSTRIFPFKDDADEVGLNWQRCPEGPCIPARTPMALPSPERGAP
ncbi:MAG: hypothetical protein AAGN82_09045 [Myxococcota bacterium]